MRVTLTLMTGPRKGLRFTFSRHDTFLVGRSKNAHFRLPVNDKAFSRLHFMVEVNPPHCRLIDLGSRNGTLVNGERTLSADLKSGDEIRAGNTVLSVFVEPDDPQTTIVFTPQASESGLMPEIPGYIPLRPIGEGALGRVYLATSGARDELRAIRIVRPRQPGTMSQGTQFIEQAAPLKVLQHAGIARLHDLGIGPNFFHFIYDYLPGHDASEILSREGPLSLARAMAWIEPLLQALEYAHERDFILRDVRPGRVRILLHEGRETAAWTSFGLDRIFAGSPLSGLSGLNDLTAQAPFLPPEFLTDYRNPTPAGDQYSAAALLYYFLTRRFIYDVPKGESRRFSLLITQRVVPVRERRRDLPEALAIVIHRGLSRQPGQRFASMAHFHQELRTAAGL